jgi:hypothetical protein
LCECRRDRQGMNDDGRRRCCEVHTNEVHFGIPAETGAIS